MLANIEDGFGVDLRFTTLPQNIFVAGSLSLLYQPSANPPYQRMKPKDRLGDHVKRSEQVIASADMAQLVREHGFYLRWGQGFEDINRQEQDRSPQPDHTRFQQPWTRSDLKDRRDVNWS